MIDKLESNWGKDASKSIQSFFDSFFDAYIKNDDIRKRICCRMLESKMEHVLGMVEDIMVREIHTKDY